MGMACAIQCPWRVLVWSAGSTQVLTTGWYWVPLELKEQADKNAPVKKEMSQDKLFFLSIKSTPYILYGIDSISQSSRWV